MIEDLEKHLNKTRDQENLMLNWTSKLCEAWCIVKNSKTLPQEKLKEIETHIEFSLIEEWGPDVGIKYHENPARIEVFDKTGKRRIFQ